MICKIIIKKEIDHPFDVGCPETKYLQFHYISLVGLHEWEGFYHKQFSIKILIICKFDQIKYEMFGSIRV